MSKINVTVTAEIDPKDISIDCHTASSYCTSDLKCDDCPFEDNGLPLDEILRMYTVMLAAEVKHAAD